MKLIINLINMESEDDVKKIQNVISKNEEIIASQVLLYKKEIVIIYNDKLFNKQRLIDSIEDLGYVLHC